MTSTTGLLVALVALVGCQGDPGGGLPGGGGGGGGGTEDDPTTPVLGTLDPGRVVLHRLNRTEYDLTVRDLLGTAQTPAREFPPDDMLAGFDNIASNLTISPLHVELYELAARSLADEVLSLPFTDRFQHRVEGEGPDVTPTTGGSAGDAWNLWSVGDLTTVVEVPVDGTYTLSTVVWADQAGPELARVVLGHDGFVDQTDVVDAANRNEAELHSVRIQLDAGVHTVSVSFPNDYYDPVAGQDRNLYVDWIDLSGPEDPPTGPNPLRDRWVTCDPSAIGDQPCLEEVLRGFLPQAWRRPVSEAEIAASASLGAGVLADGGTFEDALYWTFVAALMSPHFLFHVEIDPDPTSDEAHPLSDHEIANRLSYFLWSSMPDEELFAAAAAGELQHRENVEAQVRRMLLDDRADALVENFGGQWLYFRGVEAATKDSVTYPAWDAELAASMEEEMRRFFRSFVFEGRDLRELLLAPEGEIDARLAAHYGIPFQGEGWQTVDLAAHERGGLLGQGGLLTVTAYPARTSPVIRGKFVLGQLWCSEPAPPPPGVPGFSEDEAAVTVREQLEAHRADPVCASCHQTMDELGFALEHYDGIGAWREEDRGFPVDDSARLPDGRTFSGRAPLADIVANDPMYATCVSEKLLTYALGRVPESRDEPFVDEITAQMLEGGFTFESLAVAVATSPTFRLRRGEP